ANLMRALLKAVGIESFLMAAFAGDSNFVREEWPSPEQFNHCILAIRLADSSGPARIDHPRLGALLVFDATDPYTPLGSLPATLHASGGLLVADDAAPLVTLPRPDAAAPGVRRITTIRLAATDAGDVAQRDELAAAEAIRRRAAVERLGAESFTRAMVGRTST